MVKGCGRDPVSRIESRIRGGELGAGTDGRMDALFRRAALNPGSDKNSQKVSGFR